MARMRLQATLPPERRTFWPDAVAFQEAIQNPWTTVGDPELGGARVVLDRHGLPVAYSGRFAVVFRLRTPRGDWALRCFTQAAQSRERRERYRVISRHVAGRSAIFVPFRYVEQGIRVLGDWYPVVAMRWAEGETLGRFVEQHYDDPAALRNLGAALSELLHALEQGGIAHGDWQHDNLLVTSRGRKLTLVDYDGMFVPELAGRPSPEVGHPNYQHPARSGEHGGVGTDRFSCLVLQTALLALCREPALWPRFSDGESVLFKRDDFANPGRSPLFAAIRSLAARGEELHEHITRLEAACLAPPVPAALPPPLVRAAEAVVPAGTTGRWLAPAAETSPVPAAAGNLRARQQPGYEEPAYVARLGEPKTVRAERRHLWVMRAYGAASTTLMAHLWSLPDGMMDAFPATFFVAFVFGMGYLSWPRKAIFDHLQQDIGFAGFKMAERRARIARRRLAPPAADQHYLPRTAAQFVALYLKNVSVEGARGLEGIDGATVERLRATGIHTAADLTYWFSSSFAAGQTPLDRLRDDHREALRQWWRELEREAMEKYGYNAAPRRQLESEIRQLERERAGFEADLEELQREGERFPDASLTRYLLRLLGAG